MLSCYDVAQYFLAKTDEDAGDLMSNLKLQKLVYYAQGFALVLLNKPLFPQCIEAWIHGPVVPALYHEYKSYGTEAIPSPRELDFSKYDQETRDLLDEVYAVYGQFAVWKLRNMTHQEPPWCMTPPGQEITHDALRAYFKTQGRRVSPRRRLRRPPPTQGPRLRVPATAEEPPDQHPPLFSLRYLDRGRYGLAACQQSEKAAFADTLDRLSQRSWSELRLSPRHGLGYEQIPRHALRVSMPSHLTEDVQRLIAFRFAGNASMVGYRVQAIFSILWLDRDLTLYDHG